MENPARAELPPRHELLPLLKARFNPAIIDVLCRLAEQARATQDEIRVQAEAMLKRIELPRAGNLLVFSTAELKAVSAYWRREAFRLVWQRENWPMGAMNFEDWQRLADLADAGPGAIDLPGGVQARRVSKVLQIGSMEK